MQRNQRQGTILVVFLLLLPIIILMVGFSIDLAHMQRVRTELRSATDLAAKAAAESLSGSSDEATARQTAIDIAALNLVNGQPLSLDPTDVVFGRSKNQGDGSWDFDENKSPKNAVQITGSRTSSSLDGAIPTYFGNLYGRPDFHPEFESTSAFIDVDICIVLDRSSSMKLAATDPTPSGLPPSDRLCSAPYADSRWVALDNAIQTFLTELQTTIGAEQVAMVTFASNYTSTCGETSTVASVDRDLTSNFTNISNAMNVRSTTVWNGATDIAAGISLGNTLLTGGLARPNADKVMIVFTDGQYTEAYPAPLATAAAADGITVNTITFSPGANQTDMQAVATAGKGRHFHADNATDLDEIFREMAASLAILIQ
jgi:Ca-activated chloride channel family protein